MRFKTDGVDNLMKMEDFKDVKMYAEDIDRLEEEIEQLSIIRLGLVNCRKDGEYWASRGAWGQNGRSNRN